MADGMITRRQTLKGAAALAALTLVPEWAFPALAEGEEDVPFVDVPANFVIAPADGSRRMLDIRRVDSGLTPADQFFYIQHYNRPEVDASTWRLKLSGLVHRPTALTLSDLQSMKLVDLVNGYECSGNSGRAFQGLSSNGRFTGVRLRDVLKRVGIDDRTREVVFFGTDRGMEDVVFRQQTLKVQQQFARSITLEHAMAPDPILAWALDGKPLDRNHGFPLRLIMPGWYGVANVKWLSEIHLQEDRFLGNFQARWYRTVRAVGGSGDAGDPETQFVETEVTRMHVKSVITRVRKAQAGGYSVLGFVLNDGTPIRSVDVRVDDGPWQRATVDASNRESVDSLRKAVLDRFGRVVRS